ncbi:MAG: DNA-directed RNA polymerase subunit omega [Clostridiales bacterium]|nr:DNA-directed RNA polymerase subunit omega [Clostridiales bacterium]
MILYPMNELLTNVSSRYELVNLVAHRARQLSSDAEREKQPLEEKPVTIALNEAWAGELKPEPEDEEPEAASEEDAAAAPEEDAEAPGETPEAAE